MHVHTQYIYTHAYAHTHKNLFEKKLYFNPLKKGKELSFHFCSVCPIISINISGKES